MKQLLFLLVILGCSHSFSQSKKKQIEALNLRVDSMIRVIQNERNLNTQKVSALETKVNQLNGELTNLQEQIKLEQEKIKAKDAEMWLLQAKLKLKTDSLSILQLELAKLKPTPKIETTEKLPEVVQNGNFKTVTIGTQVWMKENLNVSSFRNGDPIPEAKTEEEWKKACENKQPAWCYYENKATNGAKYGKLYNWYAVNDSRGLSPQGFHVPSDSEWTTLGEFLGADAGKKMKSKSGWNAQEDYIECTNCKNWNAEYRRKTACHVCQDTRVNGKKTHSGNGTNSSGFSGLPGGTRTTNGFDTIGAYGYWWSSTEDSTDNAWHRSLSYYVDAVDVDRFYFNKCFGLSVRCLRD